ncbi:hypothetical protein BDW22DRAFT_1347404 [Trametopsis cervina]|nr:hypothetical protein BDW22DRAFT_1347404 [Trametopsis cervina]
MHPLSDANYHDSISRPMTWWPLSANTSSGEGHEETWKFSRTCQPNANHRIPQAFRTTPLFNARPVLFPPAASLFKGPVAAERCKSKVQTLQLPKFLRGTTAANLELSSYIQEALQASINTLHGTPRRSLPMKRSSPAGFESPFSRCPVKLWTISLFPGLMQNGMAYVADPEFGWDTQYHGRVVPAASFLS